MSIAILRLLAALTALLLAPCAISSAADVLLRANQIPLRSGAYSEFAKFQQTLAAKLEACGAGAAAEALRTEQTEGLFGTASTAAIDAAFGCGITGQRAAALTPEVWRDVMRDGSLPSLRDRIDVLVLTFEATDFGRRPEWNICQDGFGPASQGRDAVCINDSDPCSFLTWGPRGATAGQGREIQWILSRVLQQNPKLVESAFGREAAQVRRFLTLSAPPVEDCDGSSALEHFLCSVWIDPERRETWTRALTELGREGEVREAFHAIYDLDAFDGYKLRSYGDLWWKLMLVPSEIDFAFFLDRATQIGAPPDNIEQKMTLCVAEESMALTRNAAARRCLARLHPHPTKPVDRLARDVALYKEGFAPGALTRQEYGRWQDHIPVAATANFGLSDEVGVSIAAMLTHGEKIDAPTFTATDLTEAERNCPASVLKPVRKPAP